MRVNRNLERWDITMTYCCTLRLPTCAVWMALCWASKMALNRSIYWLLTANTSECYLYTEQMGVKCILVNNAVLRYFIRSSLRQPYYAWWCYFLVNNAASGKVEYYLSCTGAQECSRGRRFVECFYPRVSIGIFCIYCIFCIF